MSCCSRMRNGKPQLQSGLDPFAPIRLIILFYGFWVRRVGRKTILVGLSLSTIVTVFLIIRDSV